MLPLLLSNPQIERVRILSRGEHLQTEMQESLQDSRVDFFVGDCRDFERVKKAMQDCEVVFHFAAMKSVDKAEYDPWEAVRTNIEGTKNVINACLETKVGKAIFTSTDKAVAPLNIYGATKLVAEKLFIQSNIGRHRTRFSVCRYGNVFGSQGSVVPKWKKALAEKKPLKITHQEMTRFFLLPPEAASFVVECTKEMEGGEVFVPKMKSTTMVDLAMNFLRLEGRSEIRLDDFEWLGLRPGEKMHECLIASDEVSLVTDTHSKFIRWPEMNLFPTLKRGKKVTKAFTSYDAERFTTAELERLILWPKISV